MTIAEGRPQMLVDEFERIATAAQHEGVRLEFLLGKLGVKAVPDGDHDEIVRWVMKRCMQHRPDLWLYPERGLRVETCRNGHAKPDGALAPEGSFAGQGEWADADHVLMLLEVTSYDADTDKRDREQKPRAYAETGIPVHLLIDREAGEVLVHSAPEDGVYTTLVRRPFGKSVELPGPVDIVFDTEPLKEWVRQVTPSPAVMPSLAQGVAMGHIDGMLIESAAMADRVCGEIPSFPPGSCVRKSN